MTGPAAPPAAFADLGRAGRSRWWVWLLGVAVLAVLVVGMQALLLAVQGVWAGLLGVDPDSLARGDLDLGRQPVVDMALTLASVGTLAPAVYAVVRWVHGRTWRTVVTARPRFRWRLFAAGFAVVAAVMAASVAVNLALGLSDIRWAFDRDRFFAFLPVCLLLTPLQVLGEEVLFRGYLLQLVGRFTGRAAVRLLVPAAAFFAVHLGNPEVEAWGGWAVAQYALVALYLGWVTLRSDGLEASTGLHLGINLALSLVIGSPGDSLDGAPVLVAQTYSPVTDLASLVALCAVHYAAVVRLVGPNPNPNLGANTGRV
ncbi:MAG: CPBP family intramembrane metalloprotease [Hyphomicrobiales bacterium]|nr:CPBP family intramembrane metalloprotease [Hyphomicrobiales bacterium]MCP5370892.1 CPBP family intramembrane metalloprotease [Hyphomicrobiales bacterium]